LPRGRHHENPRRDYCRIDRHAGLAQTNLAQAAYAGSDPDQQPAKLIVTASIPPLSGDLAVARLASDVLVKPRGALRMAGCIIGIGQGIYEICSGVCWRYIDGIEYAVPCLKSVKSVEDYVRSRKGAHKTH
jgi:hypothetical protein